MVDMTEIFNPLPSQKEAAFVEGTRLLKRQISKISYHRVMSFDATEYLARIRMAFRNDDIRTRFFNRGAKETHDMHHWSEGFCQVASYIWYHVDRLPDGRPAWRLKRFDNSIRDKTIDPVYTGVHMWLESCLDGWGNGEILDLTFDQYVDEMHHHVTIPYHTGIIVSGDGYWDKAVEFANAIDIDLKKIIDINMGR